MTGNLYDLFVWQGAEMFLVIIFGSVALLKPLWDQYSSQHRGTVQNITSTFSSRRNKRLYQRQNPDDSTSDPGLLPQRDTDGEHEAYRMNEVGG